MLEVKQLTPLLRSKLGFWERWLWIHGKYYHLNNTKSSHIRTQLHTPASQHQPQTLGVTEAAARGPSPPHPQTSTSPGTQQDLKPAIPGPSPAHQGAGISPRNPWATQPAESRHSPTHHQATAQGRAWQPARLGTNTTYQHSYSSQPCHKRRAHACTRGHLQSIYLWWTEGSVLLGLREHPLYNVTSPRLWNVTDLPNK